MKLFIRFRGLPLRQVELEKEKIYRVGRSSHNEVQISAHEVPRNFGEVRFEKDHWHFFYKEQKNAPLKLTEHDHVSTPYGLELGLATYLDQESTFVSFATNPFKSKIWISVGATCAVLALAFGLFYEINKTPSLNSQNVMQFSEDRIVKFELKIKPEHLIKLKTDAGLSDEDFKTSLGFCTGFAVAKNVILTAQHCVVNPPGFEVLKDFVLKTSDGREVKASKILAMNYLQDYLFLEVEGLDNSRSFEFAESFEIGEKVYTIGNVSGEGLAIRDGIISGETEDANNPKIKHIRFSAAASPGNSGGPLLNSKGQIVALVSRKNTSENYNIGIHFRDLNQAKTEVFDNKKYSNVVYDSKYSEYDLPTLTALANRVFGLKFPDYLLSRADLVEKFKNFIVDIPMPIDLVSDTRVLETNFESAFKKLSENLDKVASANQLPGLSWESQPTKDLPVIIPGLHDVTTSSFRKINNGMVVPSELGLYGHSGFFGYDETLQKLRKNGIYKYQPGMMALRGALVEQRIPGTAEKGYLVYSSAKDSKEPLDISKMFYESPDFSISFIKSTPAAEDKEKIVLETFEKILFGNDGAIVNLKFFPFLRPKAKSEFKLKTFPSNISKMEVLKDDHGRSWNYYIGSFYGTFYAELFCTENFQSVHCLTSFRDGEFSEGRKISAKNFVYYELGEKFALTEYFQVLNIPLLNSYLKSDETLKDFSVSLENGNDLIVKVSKENKKFNFGNTHEIQSLRLVPVIKRDSSSGKSNWIGYAAHVIKKTKSGTEVCLQGIDPEQYAYHDFTNKINLSLSRQPSSVATDFFQRRAQSKAQKLFNLCVPLTSFNGEEKILDLDLRQTKYIK